MSEKSLRRNKPRNDSSSILALLANGAMDVEGLVPWSSNYTFLVKVRNGAQETLAVYKPSRGERPLWDFPSGTLAQREVAAYILAAALGWPHIPPTVLRDGPEGEGSVQLYVETVDAQHFFTLRDAHRDEMKRIAVFDAVINNTDRKGGHILLGEDGHIWCIDHGVTFHQYPKLRTVIWDFTEQPIPESILKDLCALQMRLTRADDDLTVALAELLSPREQKALRRRVDELVEARVFPAPPEDWPPVPWPPI
ncbi:MAG: SCO1664 family protein [Chloroflexota bacterium]|nr:SCO1664 family protein [Chloroflexota bacterium]